MRDMPVDKFERVLDTHGFANAIRVVEGGRHCFEAVDGLRVTPAYAPGARGERIDRRATIARIVDARRQHPLAMNEEAPGAGTPRASCVTTP
jgi:hypothetical protein